MSAYVSARSQAALSIVMLCVAGTPAAARCSDGAAAAVRFDVNDISFLWPVPQTAQEVDQLISADEPLDDGTTPVWRKELFDRVMTTAQSVEVGSSSGELFRITFSDKAAFENSRTWKVVAIRVDASAPGGHELLVKRFGSRPQIRLILQPVTVRDDGKVEVHDVTAHLVFDYLLPAAADAPNRSVPDQERFRRILNDLVAIKSGLSADGVRTEGTLGIHPGFKADRPALTQKLRTLLKKHLGDGRVTTVSFMGIQRPEPWIFFAMVDGGNGLTQAAPPPLGGAKAQMLSFRDFPLAEIAPAPKTANLGGKGVTTATLFEPGAGQRLGDLVFPTDASEAAGGIKLGDIPDIIADPFRANVFNTDCVSCHSETTRRIALNIPATGGAFGFQMPANVSGIDEAVLPKPKNPANPDDLNVKWNVRNFGWFPKFGEETVATVTMRTANEAAESVDFINRTYLAGRPETAVGGGTPAADDPAEAAPQIPEPVANALTLVMTIKSEEDYEKLKALVEGMQALPPDRNPIRVALNKLGNVHFARFVFLGKEKLLVITTYDGPFDDYIDAFTDEIGGVFDRLLTHVKDAPPLPVGEHREDFLEYVRRNDLGSLPPFYSAYPDLTVRGIRKLQRREASAD